MIRFYVVVTGEDFMDEVHFVNALSEALEDLHVDHKKVAVSYGREIDGGGAASTVKPAHE